MKTFLTICTVAMVSAGIYGFTDMAIDVKNGTMIEYDHGDSEIDDISTAVVAEKMLNDKKAQQQVQASEEKAIKKETTATTKVKRKKVVKKEAPVVDENPIQEAVVIEEARTDVKTDSAPQLIENREIRYSEFSRGAPRKYKKSKKNKKD